MAHDPRKSASLKEMMRQAGVNKLFYALDPAYIPYADPVLDAPGDIMHLFLCGITRKELAWLLDVLFKAKNLTLALVNSRIDQLNLPDHKKIPHLVAPTTSKKRRDLNLDMSASETMTFARASIVLLQPILPEAALNSKAWLCWLKHRDYLMMCLQHEFKRTDAAILDEKAQAFLKAFAEVRLYTYHSARF